MTAPRRVSEPWELLQSHSFALINRSKLLPQAWHEKLPLLALRHSRIGGSPERLPALLALQPGAPYMEALAQNLEMSQEQPELRTLCALFSLAEDIEPEPLRAHLSERLVAHLASGGRAFLRYFDPSVFPKLARIIPAHRWRLLYGPIQDWTIPFQNEWITFPAPQTDIKAGAWVLTDEQWARVEHIRLINQALTDYQTAQDAPWESFEHYSQATETAERALLTAQQHYGLQDEGDLLAYAVDALTHGEHFHLHPALQNVLRHPQGYGAASGELDKTLWAAVKAHAHHVTIERN